MKSITQLIQEVSDLKKRVISLESIVLESVVRKLATKGTSKEEVPTNAELFKKMKVVMEECRITNSERLFLSNCLQQSFLSNKQVPIIHNIVKKYGK